MLHFSYTTDLIEVISPSFNRRYLVDAAVLSLKMIAMIATVSYLSIDILSRAEKMKPFALYRVFNESSRFCLMQFNESFPLLLDIGKTFQFCIRGLRWQSNS